jgi:hypothetical protein
LSDKVCAIALAKADEKEKEKILIEMSIHGSTTLNDIAALKADEKVCLF